MRANSRAQSKKTVGVASASRKPIPKSERRGAAEKRAIASEMSTRKTQSSRPSARRNTSRESIGVSQRRDGQSTRKRIALLACALLLVLLLADHVMNFNKAYPGVHVGSIDCSGKTASEIVALLDQTYGQAYEQKEVLVYASDQARETVEATGQTEIGDEDLISVAEGREQRLAWSVLPETVSASFDEEATAQAAVAEAHGLTQIVSRIIMAVQGKQIEPIFTFGDAYTDFVEDVNATVGVERIDYNIAVNDGICSVTPGQDGVLMNDEEFQKKLIAGFLSEETTAYSFVATPEPAPVRITKDKAQRVCDTVNAAIADGANFTYEETGWNATAVTVGGWVTSDITEEGDTWQLVPRIDTDIARTDLLSHVKKNSGEDAMQVSFAVSDDKTVTVHTDSSGKIPLVDDALADLNAALFGANDASAQDAALAADGQTVTIAIASVEAPSEMSFDEALYYGVIGEITSFTTAYTHGTTSTEARNFNIHLAADLLDDSVCPAGGRWSFHDVAGECNEERGFKEAGVIEEGTYSTAFGGGICQVATTVFNAAYEAGYYIDRRYNHTIYNSSYPAGRDAAVSWPDLDLIWSNDTDSDVLLTTSYTEGTITVTLWGVSPERSVKTSVSDWEEGETYKTKYVLNTEMAPTAYRVKTKGSDGRSIYVDRTVYDKEGNQLSVQRFDSVYDPVDEIIEHGEDYEVPDDEGKGE